MNTKLRAGVRIGIGAALCAVSIAALAQTPVPMSGIEGQFTAALTTYQAPIQAAANKLFWSLALISLSWTFGTMAFRKAEIGEMFGELIKFIMTTGFMYWLLLNGPTFGFDIWSGLQTLGLAASGFQLQDAGSVIQTGLTFCDQLWQQLNFFVHPVASALVMLCGLVVLLEFALIGINLMLIHITAYFVGYVGFFVLGLGGSKWTSEYAINYYKAMLATGMQLLGMYAVVGIGMKIVQGYFLATPPSSGLLATPYSLFDLMVAVLILYALSQKIPAALSALVTGPLSGGAHTAGGVTMAGAAAAGAAVGLAAAKAGLGAATGAAGAVSAIKAAAQMAAAAGEAAASEPSGGDVSAAVKAAAAGINSMGPPPSAGNADEQAIASPGNAQSGPGAGGSASIAGQLAGGLGRMASGQLSSLADSFRQQASESLGGRLAQEIRSRGATSGNGD